MLDDFADKHFVTEPLTQWGIVAADGLDVGRFVSYKETLCQILAYTTVVKKGHDAVSTGPVLSDAIYLLRPFGGDLLLGPAWGEELRPLNEMEVLAWVT